MSKRRKRAGRAAAAPVFPSDLREILRGLARWAAASSVGMSAACGSHHLAEPMSHDVPRMPAVPAAGRGPELLPVPQPAPAGTESTPLTPPMELDAGPPEPQPMPLPTAGAPAPKPPAPWLPLDCLPDGRPDLLTHLNLIREIDYAALYTRWDPPSIITDSGTFCRTASDRMRCEDRRATILEQVERCTQQPCTPFVLTTAGDTVTSIETVQTLLDLLGAIDSSAEAILVAYLAGFNVSCEFPNPGPNAATAVRPAENGFEVRITNQPCTDKANQRYTLSIGRDGTLSVLTTETVQPQPCVVEGRRPAGLRAAAPLWSRTRLGAYFASAARFEAASVFAFERLAHELAALDAPAALVTAALRSGIEEIAHARAMTALARRFGAEPAAVEIAPSSARQPFAIALENAVEGCAGETYAALIAHCQAQSARDLAARAAFAAIAEDETRHAELAWRIAAWLEPRLTAAERQQVNAARAEAFARLVLAPQHALEREERALIGYPDPATARALASALGRQLARFGTT